jgi:poly(3-hydroxyalkanoate) synthetase
VALARPVATARWLGMDLKPPVDDAKAALATGFLLDALAPTNFLFTTPAALKRALETGGASLTRGARNFVDDLLTNGGRPRQVDTRPFRVGENLAATPGKIVFKNDLMELIQYAPQTEQVRAVPVLASQRRPHRRRRPRRIRVRLIPARPPTASEVHHG